LTTVRCVLGPDVPVDPDALRAFCVRWRDSVGADIVPLWCASVEQAIACATGDGDRAGVVVDLGAPVTQQFLGAVSAARAHVAVVSTAMPTAVLGWGEPANVFRIEGRGVAGYRWGALSVLRRSALPFAREPYGDHPEQVADLRLPRMPPPHPVVVLVHGGGWKDHWRRDIMEGLALDLIDAGYATWNLEFRRVGPSGGGWPMTFDDVAAGVEALRRHADLLDLDRLALVGHSAGGTLVLAQAARDGDGALRPRLVVSLAGVTDLVEASRRGLVGGEAIVHRLLGGTPEELPERYRAVSPPALLPLGVPQLLVQGLLDYIPDLVDLNRRYAAAARAAGDDVELIELVDADHMELIEPTSAAWSIVRARLDAILRPAARAVSA
jgi:acetyl esterase/lipase